MRPSSGGAAANPQRYRFDLVFFKRFLRLSRLMFPSWRSITVLLCIFLLSLSLLEQYIIYNIGIIPSKYYKVLGDKDVIGFKKHTVTAVILIVIEAFLTSTLVFVSGILYITWRQMITTGLHIRYFTDVLYYQLNIMAKFVDNPDQRIAQDVDNLCKTFSLIFSPLIISPFTIGYYLYQTSVTTGYLGPVSVFVFFVVATFINTFLMSPVVELVYSKERLEGDFRFKHMQLRVNAESAAFYRCGSTEVIKANQKLSHLIKMQHRVIQREYLLNFSIKMADYLGSILSYVMLAFPIFLGNFDYLTPSDLSSLISQNAFFTVYLINCFTKLIDLSTNAADMAGTAHRVSQLLEVIEELEDDSNDEQPVAAYTSLTKSERAENSNTGNVQALSINDVTYGPPKSSKILCKDLTFRFESGVNILVTGDSGCGKSSLLRVLNGLWTPRKGAVQQHQVLGPEGIFFLPQKPYFTDGTLRDQVMHPLMNLGMNTASNDEEQIIRLLTEVGLINVLNRVGGLDTEMNWNWYDELSPGEQQRLCFVRLFYHQPKFAVLDESTNQIGLEAEWKMYIVCKELGITVMTVGHRDSLKKFHDVEINLDGQGGWTRKTLS